MTKIVGLKEKFRCRLKYTLVWPEQGSSVGCCVAGLTEASRSGAPVLVGPYLQGGCKHLLNILGNIFDIVMHEYILVCR